MRILLTLLIANVAACWSSSPAPPAQEPAAASPAPVADDASVSSPPPPANALCVANEQARQACAARGPGFSYGPQPYIYCSGVAPRPEDERRAQEAIRTSACTCNDDAAVQNRREECSRVP